MLSWASLFLKLRVHRPFSRTPTEAGDRLDRAPLSEEARQVRTRTPPTCGARKRRARSVMQESRRGGTPCVPSHRAEAGRSGDPQPWLSPWTGAGPRGGRPSSHRWLSTVHTGCHVNACAGRRRPPPPSARRPEQSTVCVKRRQEEPSSEARPDSAPCGTTALRQEAARQRTPLASLTRVARPQDVFVFVPIHKPGHTPPGLPDAMRPNPGLRGRRVAAPPLWLAHRRVSSDGNTVVVCATSAPPCGKVTGQPSRADLRAP